MTTPRRALSILAVWSVATAVVLAVASLTAVGPVVITLSATHGIHQGDLVAALVAYAGAGLVTMDLLRREDDARRADALFPR